ncbi:toxic anion resistance protein [Rossellomorea marisflavi]|uniref:Toxic anion resistance protein n=1 Tax=Rossellomorea marisflavi TaxID=189381 RepID=A0A5D4RXY8_9BACI|nr:toxic anion resistance protein [Rossellomorea marisflavi]KQU59956.1 tellurite resistance protein TelA [Bacillus sp. Leaf406]MBV6683397.1 toxic anion resistance protein [Bacillus sp. JRC01]KML35252.1 tellurite resistance protein TelA [Rossellomorea marisflavi]MDW4526949.1 toxic anion resistance protein [Rossellomorea marisflavi]TYS56255.1 toxic anion resistance protein [Rossellomorea marisflavi]
MEQRKEYSELDQLLSNPFDEGLSTQPQKANGLMERLPEEQQQKAKQLAEQIDYKDYEAILKYGTAAQSQLSNFSNSMLDHVQKRDIGPIGDVLGDLMKKLELMNPDELNSKQKGVFKRLFRKVSSSIQEVLSKYQKIGSQIDRISVRLEHSKKTLMDDNRLLETLYEKNKDYFHALNMYIAAAEFKRDEIQGTLLPTLRKKAEESGDELLYQEVNDTTQFLDRLEKRIHDLKLSRQMTIQSAPQIRLIQNTNQALAEKIQASVLTAIPLWKNQIAIALTLLNQQKAVTAQKQVSQTTNDLLLKNSEMLKVNSIETAKENERGIIDIETLKKTQENLITTIEETLAIQAEGRQKRQQAEQEMVTMEQELKQKLIEIRK